VAPNSDRQQHLLAAGVNERQLFHGAPPKTIAAIVSEGFDMRMSGPGGSFGQGVYFAESSATSLGYSCKPRRGLQQAAGSMYYGGAAGSMYYGGAAGAAGGFAGPYVYPYPPMMGPGMFGVAMPGYGGGYGGTPAALAASMAASASAAAGAAWAAGACQQTGSAGVLKMVLARVVLGQQEPGNASMRRPSACKDSVHGGHGSQSAMGCCHVIFDNHQAYPEYVVSLKRPQGL
jgi:hypothetical protein